MRLHIFALAVLAGTIAPPALAQSVPELRDIKIIEGQCTPKTSLAIAPQGSAQFEQIPYKCDSVVLSYHEGPGSLMFQFVNKRAADSRLLGFAGHLESRDKLRVERVYLAGGANPVAANEGSCSLLWSAKKLTGIACAAKIDAGGKHLVPLVAFKAR